MSGPPPGTQPAPGPEPESGPEPFAIGDPLPTGTTLLEASAGTGKTWTIAALVARYVAEGRARLEEMLVVTFGRVASEELRERVRAQLVEAERALADTAAPREDNEVVDLLLDADADERALRRRRLREALGSFDAATIATTHQFCQMVLRSLGVAGDTDARARLVEDLDDLLTDVVADLYLRDFADAEDPPPFSHGEALRLARAAIADPQARLEPGDTEGGNTERGNTEGGNTERGNTEGGNTEGGNTERAGATGGAADDLPARRVAFATEVRAELDRRKRRLGVLSYDDLLSQLADALTETDAPARDRMRRRWDVVLVDEFQDTDPVQWQVLDRAFSGHATMVLIGDPKQAIYAFRGGDVTTYLRAAAGATTRRTLSTNWRCDADLLEALQVILGGAELGDPRIRVRGVAAHHSGSRLTGAGPPLRLRVVGRDLLGKKPSASVSVREIRSHVVEDVARDIKALLTRGAGYDGRALRPRDIAVLAFTHRDLREVQQALAGVGVPAVVAGSGSVFATPAATQWLRLLEALEQPHRSARVRSAALTCFFGRTVPELDDEAGGDALTDQVADRVRGWAELLASRGVAAVLEAATVGGMLTRVLGRVDGERLLTDLRHVGQSLHQVASEHRLGLVALLGWLREQMAEDKVEVAADRTRRLDSDAAAVQLTTIHGSKGLQYPVVYLPSLWDRYVGRPPAVPRFHAPDDDAEPGRRCLDVGGGGTHWQDHLTRARAEDDGESLRLLYVAATRAQCQVVAWWAPAPKNTPASPLQRMLFGRRPGWAEVPAERELHPEERVSEILGVWQERRGPVWEKAAWAEPAEEELHGDDRSLSVRRFDRHIDTGWRRTSYSGLSAAANTSAAGVGSEPEEPPRDDEPDAAAPAVRGAATGPGADTVTDPEAATAAVASPMASLPVGARFGSLVHGVLELADPAAPDLRAELLAHIAEQRVRWPVEVDADVLADALVRVCQSPLGPLAGEATLRDIGRRDRLCEMDFELPLSGGDVRGYPAAPVRLGDVAPLLRAHLLPGDPLLGYADTLGSDPGLGGQDLRGYLTGSVDVVLRVPDGPGDGAGPGGHDCGTAYRYLVVDYKTNWLGGLPGEDGATPPLTAQDYHPQVLREAMGHSDYPLQALLYAVVLHRYLRWRLPGYDPDVHLGGVLYLYLRGMCGPATPVVDGHPCGVFSWRPPTVLVTALSDLLDGVAPSTPRAGTDAV